MEILNKLDENKIFYKLSKIRNSIMIEIAVPGQRWEVEIMDDETIEIEIFESKGEIYGEEKLKDVYAM